MNKELKKHLVDFYKYEPNYGKYAEKVVDQLDDLSVGCLYGMADMIGRLDLVDTPNHFDLEFSSTAYKLMNEMRRSIINKAIEWLTLDAYDIYVGLVDSCDNMGDLDA